MKLPKQEWIMNSLFYIFTSAAFIYIFFIGIKNIFRYNIFKQEHDILQAQLLKESQINTNLKSQIQALDTPEYWEMQAREKLGFIISGERVLKPIQ